MWKKIAAGIAILLIMVAAGGYYFLSNLNSIIRDAIGRYGSEATGTQVKAGNVSLSLTAGTGAISGLTVANPPGYSMPYALSLGHIAIALDTSSLAGKGPIIINSITIAQPQVSYELKGLSPVSNLGTIQAHLQNFAGNDAAAQPGAQGGMPARKEIIRSLTITGGQITALAPALASKPRTEPLPPLHFTNLGGPDGASPAQLGAQMLNIVLAKAVSAGAASLIHQSGAGTLPVNATGILQGLLGK